MTELIFPPVRGRLTPQKPLCDLTWLRVGGPADMLFQPADSDDLRDFLRALPAQVAVFPMGVGSNVMAGFGPLSSGWAVGSTRSPSKMAQSPQERPLWMRMWPGGLQMRGLI